MKYSKAATKRFSERAEDNLDKLGESPLTFAEGRKDICELAEGNAGKLIEFLEAFEGGRTDIS